MRQFTEREAKERFDELVHIAQSGPVAIRRDNRDVAYIVSPAEYERLRKLNIEELTHFCDRVSGEAVRRGLTEEKLERLLNSEE